MNRIEPALLARLPLSEVTRVTFHKRDELTTDLICCEVQAGGETWFFHEEMEGWDRLILHLEGLEGFCRDWFARVSQPPLAPCETVAFRRA